MKYVRIIFIILLTISVVVLGILAMVRTPQRACTGIQVVAHTENESVLLQQGNIEKMLAQADIKIVGERMKDVDLSKVSTLLKSNPYIQNVNFVHFAGTRLVIDYTLRNIVLHVYSKDGDQYFVDTEGFLLPYSVKMTDYLIIANGNISQHYKKGAKVNKELKPVLELTNKILADDFYKAQFRQIYLNEHHQMEMVTTLGSQVVLLGNLDNIDEKLGNLKKMYKNGLANKGFENYAQFDVRYKNRIIAQRIN